VGVILTPKNGFKNTD